MNTQQEYEVLRLIEHNRICYVSSDVIKGWPLVKWLESHSCLSKDQLLQLMRDIVCQLIQIHKCRGNPCYQYVNPYSMIVSEEGKLCFLNMMADSNREKVRIMLRSNIRDYFLPAGYSYRDTDEELDIYGLGKTIQYLLAFTVSEPEFTWAEKRKIQKTIEKCVNRESRKRFRNIEEVKGYLLKKRIK